MTRCVLLLALLSLVTGCRGEGDPGESGPAQEPEAAAGAAMNWIHGVDARTEQELGAALDGLKAFQDSLEARGYKLVSTRSSTPGDTLEGGSGDGPTAVERVYRGAQPPLEEVEIWMGGFDRVLAGTEISVRLTARPVPESEEETAAWLDLRRLTQETVRFED